MSIVSKYYLDKANHKQNLRKGWNTLYITDVFNNVPFYVRGNEFTAQLYDFAESLQSHNESLSTFDSAASTLNIVEKIKLGK